jgi:DNA-binding MarR family transcriptional regulator
MIGYHPWRIGTQTKGNGVNTTATTGRRTRRAGAPVEARLMARLTVAMDWFDNSLQNVLASCGFEPVHRTQSLILMHIAMGIDAPSDIAREMGLTRQNVHHMAKDLIRRGVIDSLPDSRDPRRSCYRLSEKAADLRRLALRTLAELEEVLETRIGAERVRGLRNGLFADWGPEIGDEAELRAALPRRKRGRRA